MKPDPRFTTMPPHFWAYVRSISQWVGYTRRGTGTISVPTTVEVRECLNALKLSTAPVLTATGKFTEFGEKLHSYFAHRADVLNLEVEPALMNAEQAAEAFQLVREKLASTLFVPLNKQKGDKKKEAYFTGLVHMLVDASRGDFPCDYDPRVLTSFTKSGVPVRTMSRRVDGAFPAAINPIAIWEIKEYYYTTTFGSRVADGVYETQLDGMELEEMRVAEGLDVRHYLFLDAHYTWWKCGRSYLCRIFDMVHMRLVDEVVVGREVITRVPVLVEEWIEALKSRNSKVDPPKSADDPKKAQYQENSDLDLRAAEDE
jgi:hypothetical protein